MSEYTRRGECLEAVAKVNSNLCWLQESVKKLRKDMGRLEAENKALKDKVQLLEIRHEELRGRTLGWQEGFGEGVRKQLRYMDERIANLLESDDSGDFEIGQWIEELKSLRKDFSALEKRVEFIEKFKPVIVKEEPPSVPQPIWPTYQPTRTVPRTGSPNPLDPSWKITCQKEP